MQLPKFLHGLGWHSLTSVQSNKVKCVEKLFLYISVLVLAFLKNKLSYRFNINNNNNNNNNNGLLEYIHSSPLRAI